MIRDSRRMVFRCFRRLPKVENEDFIGFCELMGCFIVEDARRIFDELIHGEILSLSLDETKHFSVKRSDGTELGYIPRGESALLKKMYQLGFDLFTHIEAKELKGDSLALAVSLYTKY